MSDFEQFWNANKSTYTPLGKPVETYKNNIVGKEVVEEIWNAAIASMQGEAVGYATDESIKTSMRGDSAIFGGISPHVGRTNPLFTYPPSAASKIAEQDARIKELEQQLEVARKGQDGYALVPIEPTAAMVDSGVKFENFSSYKVVRDIYDAMLSAAPDAAIRQIGGAE